MSYEAYRAIRAVNWSTLKEMRRSPLHYRYARDNQRPDTPAMRLGRMVHARVFEAVRFAAEYVTYAARRQGKKWDEFKAEHAAYEIVTEKEYEYAQQIGEAVESNPIAAPYLARGNGEQIVRWTDETTGLPCKCRLDFRSESKPAVVDLKTAADISPHRFASQVARLGYHGQGAFYTEGVRRATGDTLPFVVIAVESAPPFDVIVYRLDEDALYAGEEEYREYLRRVVECERTGVWPGRYDTEQALRLPSWAWPDDEEAADTGDMGLTFEEPQT